MPYFPDALSMAIAMPRSAEHYDQHSWDSASGSIPSPWYIPQQIGERSNGFLD
jgi:hypothetical protein